MESACVSVTSSSPSRPDSPSSGAAESAGVDGHRLPVRGHVLVHDRLPATGHGAPAAATSATVCVQHPVSVIGADRRGLQGSEAVQRGVAADGGRRGLFSGRVDGHDRRGRLPAELVPDLWQDLRAPQHAEDAPPHALRRETVPVRRLQQVVQPGGQSDGARSHALRRKAVPVPDLRPPVLAVVVRHHAHAHPLGRAAVPVPPVQEGVQRLVHAHQTPAHTLGRKAVPVQTLLTPVLAVRQPEPSHARAQRHERRCRRAAAGMTVAGHHRRRRPPSPPPLSSLSLSPSSTSPPPDVRPRADGPRARLQRCRQCVL